MKRLGVCYYPELYPDNKRQEFMAEDIRLMKEAGFSVVRMAEFCWCLMEPEEGVYEFDWLEEYVNLLGENGIYTILCTPTACQPVWMAEKYPSTLYVDNYGVQRSYGGRHYHCYNDPIFRKFTVDICREMGKRFGNNPYVIGWQVDNEMAQEHSGRCQCPTCTAKFQNYLREVFHNDIHELNEAFGSLFWGQRFDNFEQIKTPVAGLKHNTDNNFGWLGTNMPTLRLMFDRFSSDSIIDFFNIQKEVIKEYSDKPVTHNTTHFATRKIDYFKLGHEMDVAGVDHYQAPLGQHKLESGVIYSMNRNYKKKDFWMLETLCGGGHGNWAYQGMAHCPPGMFRQNMAYAYASGAELITAFKWCVFASGFEQLGSAMIDLDRIPGRRYEEFKQAGQDLVTLSPILDKTSVKSEVAIVMDYDCLWIDKIKPFHKEFLYHRYIRTLYRHLTSFGINVDIIGSDKTLDEYKAVFVPFAPVLPDYFKQECRNYVTKGGNLFAMCMPFSRNEWGNGEFEKRPLGLTDFFGVRVKEEEPVFAGKTEAAVAVGDLKIQSYFWQETLETYDAETIGVFADTYRKGDTVIARKKNGDGYAYYMGTVPAEEGAKEFFGYLLEQCNVTLAPIEVYPGIEVVTRQSADATYYFIFNSTDDVKQIVLKQPLKCLEDGREISGVLEMKAREYIILYFSK